MEAGKSKDLIETFNDFTARQKQVLVLTSAIDNRHESGSITTRSGHTLQGVAINSIDDTKNTLASLAYRPDLVLIDEIQFLSYDTIKFLKDYFVFTHNVPIIVCGLRSNYAGRLFEGSSTCFAIADKFVEIESTCKHCDRHATMNLRLGLARMK